MPNQDDPVTPDENVLRRISNNKDWVNLSLAISVQRVAFKPFTRDTDGLSVFRELFVTPYQVATAGPNSNGYYVARLNVNSINDLGLNIVPDPQEDQLQGHALMPELSYGECKKK